MLYRQLKYIFLIILSPFFQIGNSQDIINDKFDKKLKSLLSLSVPVISVEEAYDNCTNYIFLDARELEEYKVSRIQNARFIGHTDFKLENVEDLERDTEIIIYCSIGYRSEKIGEQLSKAGFKNVKNLYGSIFEWANQGYPLVDAEGNVTDRIHTYNKSWSKWVEHPEVQKVW